VSAKLPLLATVDKAAATPRQSAYGIGRRGQIVKRDVSDAPIVTPAWEERPARKRPKRLKVMTGGSASDRLKAASQMQAGKGTLMVNPDPQDAARAIHSYLMEEGILKS
jgi:electron transfer flavoprotein beta subunit